MRAVVIVLATLRSCIALGTLRAIHEGPHRRSRSPVWRGRPTTLYPLHTFRERSRRHAWAKPCLAAGLTRQDLHIHASLATPRERSRAHAWAKPKPCLAARSYTLPHLLATSRERSRTHAWAKPCLAGRPTMLVRTQPPEQNTSRGRPPGMELPDYPVVATLPTPLGPGWARTSASHPVFSQIRTSFCFPPGLFSNSYLVLAPTGALFKFVARSGSDLLVPCTTTRV
jgi:hypothetical protein